MYIKVNNINIHYTEIGKGEPIILLNPNSTDTKSMTFIAKKLAKDFKVYIFRPLKILRYYFQSWDSILSTVFTLLINFEINSYY